MADLSQLTLPITSGGTTTDQDFNIKDATARSDISTINGKIPSGASSSNKMATADDVASRVDWSSYAKTGVHQLLNNEGVSGTYATVTITTLANKSFTVNGTAGGNNASYQLMRVTLPKGKYILGKTGRSDGYYQVVNDAESQELYSAGVNDALIELSVDTVLKIRFRMLSGAVFNNETFYPLLRLASDTDPTYAPYAMTNQQLTEAVASSEGSFTDNVAGSTFEVNSLQKFGRVVVARVLLSGVTANAWTPIASIPEGFRPGTKFARAINLSKNTTYLEANGGIIQCSGALNNENAQAFFTWLTP